MGLLPTYAAVGVLAPLLLTFLRLVQGFALGGEWGGAVLLAAEHGSAKRRGLWASWPQAGVPAGSLLAAGVLALLAQGLSDADFLAWGWRIPFLMSFLLVVVGWWIRRSVAETPSFRQAVEAAGAPPKLPAIEVLRERPRALLTGAGLRLGENIIYYVITVFSITYMTQVAHLTKAQALNAILVGAAIHFFVIPLMGALSDRIGRRIVYAAGGLGGAGFAFLFFPMLGSGDWGQAVLAVTIALVLHGAMYGPQAAFFSELFGTRVRYSGSSIGYQLASIAAGALAPLIATALLKAYGSSVPISVYVLITCVITVVAIVIARETRGADLEDRDRVGV
jgi:MFS family permease